MCSRVRASLQPLFGWNKKFLFYTTRKNIIWKAHGKTWKKCDERFWPINFSWTEENAISTSPLWARASFLLIIYTFHPKYYSFLLSDKIHHLTQCGMMDSSKIFSHPTKRDTMKYFVEWWKMKSTHGKEIPSSKRFFRPRKVGKCDLKVAFTA